MFCRKCGKEIPDDSVFCLKCGKKIEVIEAKETIIAQDESAENDIDMGLEDVVTSEVATASEDDNTESNESGGNGIIIGLIALVVIMLMVVIIKVTDTSKDCSVKGCDNSKISNGDYCHGHTCEVSDCTLQKEMYGSYCHVHEKEYCCSIANCNMDKTGGGEYCYNHTCSKSGCYNEIAWDSKYCTEHQVNMKELLELKRFSFGINSAGGIEFYFGAKNKSTKEIKYIRFYVDLYNAVGDRILDEIKDTPSVYVEVTGPVKTYDTVEYEDIIGYNDNCARIEIGDITIIYMDGTSETGHYGYYYER